MSCNPNERRIGEIRMLFELGLKENDPTTYKELKKELDQLLKEQIKE